jgi:hypothetical protein
METQTMLVHTIRILSWTFALSLAGANLMAAEPPSAKTDLTSASFSKHHALIRPQPNEWRHLQVNWMTDVIAARTKAAAEDKPLVILYTGGAGYNEPLGVC